MTFYDYKFVRVKVSFWTGKPKEDYHQIIRDHAGKGWRLVQIHAPAISGHGKVVYFELIFEKARE